MLGFLPIDESKPDSALIAEYFLNECIFKDKESSNLDSLDLT